MLDLLSRLLGIAIPLFAVSSMLAAGLRATWGGEPEVAGRSAQAAAHPAPARKET